MATLEQLSTALVNADKAGDVPAAKALAAEISRMRQAQASPAAPTPAPPAEDNGGIIGSLEAFGRSAANMAGMGFMDEIGAAVDSAGSKIFPWRTPKTYDEALTEGRADDKRIAEAHPIANVAGIGAGALGLGSGLVRAGLSPTAAVAGRGYGLIPTSIASAGEAGILGGVQGFGQGEGVDDRLDKATSGFAWGTAIGGALPGVVSLGANTVRRLITPNTIAPERQAATNVLAREGVDSISAGQATGNAGLRYAESEIGGQAAQDMVERGAEQFTAAALRRGGATANRATPDVLDANFRRIGNEFDTLAANNQLHPDRQLAQDLGGAWREYASLVPETARAPVVENMIQDLGRTLSQGPLDGAAYQAARSRLDRYARGAAADPQLQDALYGIRNALDDAMERTMTRMNPQDLGRWQTARRQYRNMLTIERAATGAGENAALGLISPSQLRNATVVTQGRRAYGRGNGDFAELARAGEAIMKSMPNSGTAGRFRAQNVGTGLLSTLGAIGGTSAAGPVAGVAGAAVGAMTPRVVGQIMMSRGGQAYLRNQLLRGNLPAETRALIVNSLNSVGSAETPRIDEAIR
jgi:hypothetical protein